MVKRNGHNWSSDPYNITGRHLAFDAGEIDLCFAYLRRINKWKRCWSYSGIGEKGEGRRRFWLNPHFSHSPQGNQQKAKTPDDQNKKLQEGSKTIK